MSTKFSFADLKKRSKNSVEKLQERLKSTERKGFQKDERYWTPTKDDNGNALAVIRFLPAPPGEELSYVTYYDHRFQVNNRWYVERSLTTLGKDDPVGEANKKLWDTGDEDKRKIASSRKRGLNYVANILVIKDTGAPENNGKVFLYRFGAKVFGKIKDQAQPELDDDTPVDVFNIFEGANFRLKVKKQGEFPSYDDSTFENPSPLAGGDEKEMERIWNSCYSLEAEVAEDKFKSYDDLKKKLDWVLSGRAPEVERLRTRLRTRSTIHHRMMTMIWTFLIRLSRSPRSRRMKTMTVSTCRPSPWMTMMTKSRFNF